eukprot:gnl/Hemi2/24828_TR8344_c0_g1_i1.p1 gnl/Hemi2/24828_TR8344_c0_g1~~gnl/Hemi2/24828_TR8344_c0_g1_i1.p1  ORF type:complete len:321 (+),score=66.93 gnl/Hemi2/24828_TR8344_c0_g1_i1:94-1056(+)
MSGMCTYSGIQQQLLLELQVPFGPQQLTEDRVLSPGPARYRLLEWLFARADADLVAAIKSDLVADVDESEASIVQRLLLFGIHFGVCGASEIACVQGLADKQRGLQFLQNLVDFAIMSTHTSQPTPDLALLSYVARNQTSIFSDECNIFPADVVTGPVVPDWDLMHAKCEEVRQELQSLAKLAASKPPNSSDCTYFDHPDPFAEEGVSLQNSIRGLCKTISSFEKVFATDFAQWVKRESHASNGLGETATRVSSTYQKLSELLASLHNIQHSASVLRDSSAITKLLRGPAAKFDENALLKLKDNIQILEKGLARRKLMAQ